MPSLIQSVSLLFATASAALVTPAPHAKLVFVRHGQSTWNKLNLFTGWVDVELSELGVEEATAGGLEIKKAGLNFDIAFTSMLQRAQKTCTIALEQSEQTDCKVIKDYRLNERHYGALQGKDKKETVLKYAAALWPSSPPHFSWTQLPFGPPPLHTVRGRCCPLALLPSAVSVSPPHPLPTSTRGRYGDDQVAQWRRSYDIPPPPVEEGSEHDPCADPLYADIDPTMLPYAHTPSSQEIQEALPPFLPRRG